MESIIQGFGGVRMYGFWRFPLGIHRVYTSWPWGREMRAETVQCSWGAPPDPEEPEPEPRREGSWILALLVLRLRRSLFGVHLGFLLGLRIMAWGFWLWDSGYPAGMRCKKPAETQETDSTLGSESDPEYIIKPHL